MAKFVYYGTLIVGTLMGKTAAGVTGGAVTGAALPSPLPASDFGYDDYDDDYNYGYYDGFSKGSKESFKQGFIKGYKDCYPESLTGYEENPTEYGMPAIRETELFSSMLDSPLSEHYQEGSEAGYKAGILSDWGKDGYLIGNKDCTNEMIRNSINNAIKEDLADGTYENRAKDSDFVTELSGETEA